MFEDSSRVADLFEDGQDESLGTAPRGSVAALKHQMAQDSEQRIFLPRGSAETRFAPPQYFYLASKSGVMPSWAIGLHHSAHFPPTCEHALGSTDRA